MMITATATQTSSVILVNHTSSPKRPGRKKSSTFGGNGSSPSARTAPKPWPANAAITAWPLSSVGPHLAEDQVNPQCHADDDANRDADPIQVQPRVDGPADEPPDDHAADQVAQDRPTSARAFIVGGAVGF